MTEQTTTTQTHTRKLPPIEFRITPATGAAMARKRWEAHRAAKEAAKAIPAPLQTLDALEADRAAFLQEQRDSLRTRLRAIAKLMSETTDAQELDRLASAWSKLAPLEAQMDRRPNLAPVKSDAKPARAHPLID